MVAWWRTSADRSLDRGGALDRFRVAAGEVWPALFFMLSESLIETFRAKLGLIGLELADLRIGGTPNRPLVQVRIEWPASDPERRVTVDDCARASRALEAWLDGGDAGGAGAAGPLGPRYMLEVSSPGIDRALRWPHHWARFVGREVQATVAGIGRIRARIVAVPDQQTVVLEREGRETRTVRLADVRDARLAVDW
jgi:ribosome maturation factor RimP